MRSIFSTVFLMTCFSAFCSHQDLEYDFQTDGTYKKLYLDAEKVAIHNGRMFLYTKDNLVELNALFF